MKILSVITVLALIIFAAFPSMDLQVSHAFFTEGQGFVYRNAVPSLIIYYSVRILTLLTIMMCLFVLFYEPLKKFIPAFLNTRLEKIRSMIKFTRKQIMYLFLVIVITPGILVHWVIKPVWDRARPVNVTEFGGEKQFTSFYHLRAGQDGNSFPSGHASMSFSLVAFAYIVSQKNRKKVATVTITYAVIASIVRIVQGGHYLSDVTFSAILTIWTILLLRKFYLDKV